MYWNVRQVTLSLALALTASAGLLLGGVQSAHAQGANGAGQAQGDRGPFPTGVWYAASDTGFPQLFAFLAVHSDGTFTYDSTAETGGVADFPGEYTPLHGLWARENGLMVLRGFAIQETETPAGSFFAVVRLTMALEAVGDNELLGTGDVDFLPCGDERNCPNPDDSPLVIGEGVTGGVPLQFRRISRSGF
jgi:hypothetical protein